MTALMNLLTSHRSIRKYKSDPIPAELLNRILECGLRASSHGNMNSWSVVVTTERAGREKLYELHHEQEMILQAPVVLTFCADFHRTRRWVKLRGGADSFDDLTGFLTGAFDAVIAAQNIASAAESNGLGICYMGTTLWAATAIAKELHLPENVVPVTSMVMGVPDENPAVRDRLPLDAIVHRETYAEPSDEALLANYANREIKGWERYLSIPEIRETIERLDLKNVAQYYTCEDKYPKSIHASTSKDYLALLKDKGFFNF